MSNETKHVKGFLDTPEAARKIDPDANYIVVSQEAWESYLSDTRWALVGVSMAAAFTGGILAVTLCHWLHL